MSAVDAVGGSGGVAAPDRFSELSSDEFLDIIFTELANQDPLQPNDSSALLEQLSSIRSIQSDIDLQERLSTLVTQNELSSAAGMIGKFISGLNETNHRVFGLVDSVSRTDQGTVLNLFSGERVSMEKVDEIVDPDILFGDDEDTNETDDTGSDQSGNGEEETP